MTGRQPFDLHSLQHALLTEDMAEEKAQRRPAGRSRALPPGMARGGGVGVGRSVPRPLTLDRELDRVLRGPSVVSERFSMDPAEVQPRETLVPQGPFDPHSRQRESFINGSAPPPKGASGIRAGTGTNFDIKEALKEEMMSGSDDHFELKLPSIDTFGVTDQYIVLDSFHKDSGSSFPEAGLFHWIFMVEGTTREEQIGTVKAIERVIEVAFGPFNIPLIQDVAYPTAPPPAAAPGLNSVILVQNPSVPMLAPAQIPTTLPVGSPWVNDPLTQLPFGNRLTIQMREAGRQAYSATDSTLHHFEFDVAYMSTMGANPNMLQVIPANNQEWAKFIFTEPIYALHEMTLVFRNPDTRVRFLPDCLYTVRIESDGAAYPGPFLRFVATTHGLLLGDRIYVTKFVSGNAALDAYVNRVDGLNVGGVPPLGVVLGADSWYTNPAISIADLTLPVPTLPRIATVCIAKRRIRIPARFRCILPKRTNFITPV